MNRSHLFTLFATAMFIMVFFLPALARAQDTHSTVEANPIVILTPVPTVSTPITGTTGIPSASTETIFNGLMLLVVVLIVAFLVLVFMVLRSRSASGDANATRWLSLLEAGRNNFFPPAQTEAWIAKQENAAKATTDTPLDDMAIALIKAGWHVIAPTSPDAQRLTAQGTVTQTTTTTVTDPRPTSESAGAQTVGTEVFPVPDAKG